MKQLSKIKRNYIAKTLAMQFSKHLSTYEGYELTDYFCTHISGSTYMIAAVFTNKTNGFKIKFMRFATYATKNESTQMTSVYLVVNENMQDVTRLFNQDILNIPTPSASQHVEYCNRLLMRTFSTLKDIKDAIYTSYCSEAYIGTEIKKYVDGELVGIYAVSKGIKGGVRI